MKKLSGVLWCLGVVAFLMVSVRTQAAAVTNNRVASPLYVVSKEVTLEGNVSAVKALMPGHIPGGHMVVITSKGTIDGHLGPYALNGKNRISVPVGAHVKIVGVMATIHGSQVFLVRTIDTGTNKYTIRSEHGFLLIPGAVQPTKSINFVSPKGGR
ncbi:MAG: hypothetical protein WA734_00125 [Candidatus Acidiferrales bacterium]